MGLVEGSLVAFVSNDPPGGFEPSERTLSEHEAVVEDLMESGPVLPMHFGSAVYELRALLAVLHARAGELRRGLERVRGRVELGVRALEAGRAAAPRRPPGGGPPRPPAGRGAPPRAGDPPPPRLS